MASDTEADADANAGTDAKPRADRGPGEAMADGVDPAAAVEAIRRVVAAVDRRRGDGADVPRSGPAGPGRPDEDDTGVRMYGTETGEPSPRIGDSSPDETENGPDGDDRDEGEPEPSGDIASALAKRRVRVVAALAGVVLGIALARRLGDGDETEDGD